MTWVLWDWNGTLLDDTAACLAALNAMLTRRGRPPITRDFYRETFSFPVRPFYEKIGVRLADEDWNALAREYHDAYRAEPCALNVETVAALEAVRAAGARQAIISALRQDLLDQATARFGVDGYMTHIYGVDNLDGGSKLARARELAARIRADDPAADLVLIGDALHDGEVAAALGARAVLFSGGGHAAHRLRAVAPTGDTLRACVRLALEPAANRKKDVERND